MRCYYADRGKWSYLVLADELRRRSRRSAEDLAELFRRMVFNALISNTDDHPRNHALVALGRDWELSRARIVDQMREVVCARWSAVMQAQGVTEADCERLADAFAYHPGFGLDPEALLGSLAWGASEAALHPRAGRGLAVI